MTFIWNVWMLWQNCQKKVKQVVLLGIALFMEIIDEFRPSICMAILRMVNSLKESHSDNYRVYAYTLAKLSEQGSMTVDLSGLLYLRQLL